MLSARSKFYELPKSRIDFAECLNDRRFEFSRVGVHLFFERRKRKEENNKGRVAEAKAKIIYPHVFHDYLIDLATKTSWTSKTKGSLVQRYVLF